VPQAGLTLNLPKPFLPEPLAEAGAGRCYSSCPARTLLTEIIQICRCPAGAFLAANLRTSRRWRLFFVRFLWVFVNRAVEVPGMSLRYCVAANTEMRGTRI